MRWRGLAGIVFIGALGDAACGSGPAPPEPPAPLELEEFLSAFATAYCHRVYTCCSAGEVPVVSPGTDEPGCATEMEGLARDNARFLLSYHGIVFDPMKATRCMDVLKDGACPMIFEHGFGRILPCQDIFVGSLAANVACDDDHECLSGRCDGATCTGSTPLVCSAAQFLDDVSDVCIQRHALGEACNETGECGAEESCVGGVCILRRADGELCESAPECVGTCQLATDGSGQGLCRPGFCHGP